MNKKLFIGLAPLLAIATVMAMPALAQAASPHFYKNSSPMTERTPYISWGKLALSAGTGAPVECENAVGGWDENPSGSNTGAAGLAETNGWVAYNCKDVECEGAGGHIGVIFENENDPQATPVKLDWPGELTEKKVGTIRLHTTNVRVTTRCQFVSLPTTEEPYAPEPKLELRVSPEITAPGVAPCTTAAPAFSEPKLTNGLSIGISPSKTVFNKAGGELECGTGGKGITTGELKTEGFNGEELITTATP
jgi:hypothetical protein